MISLFKALYCVWIEISFADFKYNNEAQSKTATMIEAPFSQDTQPVNRQTHDPNDTQVLVFTLSS